ncbi:unnamed protein product [Brachionus calyciflorus]|uniref:Ig-like domain-containing protein n=1 Tax=Brachionus calyciflorus TaxID=104777 RepID=A0A813VTL7_9BILA|nr:unnamed protein product [Brachionus calyciflorus]
MKFESSILNFLFIYINLIVTYTSCQSYFQDDQVSVTKSSTELNKEFWETLYQNSLLNTRNKYNVLNDEKVCFTCPVDRSTFTSLYHEAIDAMTQQNQQHQAPPRVTISWIAQLNENRVIHFCSNNTRKVNNPLQLSSNGMNSNEVGMSTQLEFSCENNRLCLHNVKNAYPKNYQCLIKSYVLDVKLDVIVQLTHVLLYFTGDSVKFDYQKEVQVHENQIFTVKCEVPESNPVSIVKAYIDNKELKLTGLEKKTVENRMTINTYSFEVNATRSMNGKKVKCDAQMKDIPTDLANSIDLRSHLFKDYTISVYYLPTCVYKERTYRTGINRSITIECPINGSNPDVTYYKMIPPSTRTKFELIDNNIETLKRVGKYKINPTSQADFGLYECIPRSLAGTAKCDIIVELGSTPNPPEMCTVQFAKVNNKTFAQFSCKPGHNQGGSTSFLSIYEVIDQHLKLSGRVNIDESKMDKEVPYISPADEDKYYEFLIMQENNYGNSTSILLTLGTLKDSKAMHSINFKNFYIIAGGIAGVFFIFCLCGCCCCSDIFGGSSKNDNSFCKCCSPSEHNESDDGLTYKKAPMDSEILQSRTYQPYSTDIGTLKYGYNQNYDYYDNTSTGLLGEPTNYERFGTVKSKKVQIVNSSSYETNQDDSYGHDYEENEYMDDKNDSDESKDENKEYTPKITKSKNASESFNNNVSVSIGSGVESIRKHTYNLGSEIYGKKTKLHSNGTSTIDRKNLIKTDNGLVYTPLDGKEDEVEYDNCDEMKAKESSKYSSVKRVNNPIQNKLNSNFQAELSQKLKSINNEEIYSKNLKVKNTIPTVSSFNQSEQLSNSTATTSVSSSASSCASNSDLIIKNKNNLLQRPLPPTPIESKNYSLLKTTISVNSDNGTLGKNKPPILKPKPRTNSGHNQSIEPLLNGKFDSPNTSVTDVSSTNCTPQHCNLNLLEDVGSKNTMNRKVNPNSIYSTIKLNCDYTPSNVTLKTFSPNYENRAKKSPTSIDDEIKAINSRVNVTRTMERRHVKNSEC